MTRDVPELYMKYREFNFEERRRVIHLMKKEGEIWFCWEGTCEEKVEKIDIGTAPEIETEL